MRGTILRLQKETRIFPWFYGLIGAVLFALGALTITFTLSLDASDRAAEQTKNYDVGWSGEKGRLEVTELDRHVSRYLANRNEADAQAAQLFFQIVLGRLQTWASGDFGSFVKASPEREAEFRRITTAFRELEDDFERFDEAAPDIMKKLEIASRDVHMLGAEAHTVTVARDAVIRDELKGKQKVQRILFISLALTGLLLLAVMAMQNHLLGVSRREAERTAADYAFLARHDPLTGLPNRSALIETLSAEEGDMTARGGTIAVLAIDLDGFKAVNDTLGHQAGDALLNSISLRLKSSISNWNPLDVASRFGGDEFVLLLHVENRAQAMMKAQWLLHVLSEPHLLADGKVTVGASIGVALGRWPGMDPSVLLANADLALNHAKAQGKNMVQEYEPGMRALTVRRTRMEADLRAAIMDQTISAAYQLQVDLKSGQVVGVEALARWKHPELGWISPAEFVPLAESAGQVVELDRMILERACADAMLFPAELPVSVNVSVSQLIRDDFAEITLSILEKAGLPARRLKMEVTESVVMKNPERAVVALQRLKDLGISVSLDDFGTGYSALSYLRMFQWDEIKIDRSFVSNIENDALSLSIIEAIVRLAAKHQISITAEGVENEKQKLLLDEIGCNVGQGYLFGRPVAVEELNSEILRYQARAAGGKVVPYRWSADARWQAVAGHPL